MGVIDNTFLSLVRLGIGNATNVALPKKMDWNALEDLAAKQGLSAVMVDGLEKLSDYQKPPKPVLLQWIGETLQGYEYRYELYRRTIAELAEFYNDHGFKMMVLKGYACSLDWPKPEHRPCGDIDIWQFGQQKEADNVLAKEKGVEIDLDHHIHTVFNWRDFTVENHYDFVNMYDYPSSKKMESIFKQLGKDDSHYVELYGERVYLPSPNLHALFLLRHMVTHFAAANITLRQVLDWAFFVERHTKEIDWKWLVSVLEEYHMKDFYNCLNAICVEDLGFPIALFPNVESEKGLKERVLQDILSPQYEFDLPKGLLKRIAYKVRRRRGNAWKRKLCFEESGFSSFMTSVWSHLLRPDSI